MENIRAAFREVALGLMEWADLPEPALHRDIGRYLAFVDAARAPVAPRIERVYRPRGKQETPEYVEPFDVQADWDERA